MAMDLKEIEKYIKEALPDASIEIQDLAGDGNHYSATVTSSKFAGKSKIEHNHFVAPYDASVSFDELPDAPQPSKFRFSLCK